MTNTPLPWHLQNDPLNAPRSIDIYSGKKEIYVGYTHDDDITIDQALANAKLIIQAVNNHHALVVALEKTVFALNAVNVISSIPKTAKEEIDVYLNHAKAALAQAKGDQS